jgi:hypothetical protein
VEVSTFLDVERERETLVGGVVDDVAVLVLANAVADVRDAEVEVLADLLGRQVQQLMGVALFPRELPHEDADGVKAELIVSSLTARFIVLP